MTDSYSRDPAYALLICYRTSLRHVTCIKLSFSLTAYKLVIEICNYTHDCHWKECLWHNILPDKLSSCMYALSTSFKFTCNVTLYVHDDDDDRLKRRFLGAASVVLFFGCFDCQSSHFFCLPCKLIIFAIKEWNNTFVTCD